MRKVVGVLRGGPSREYDVSLKTGSAVLEALDRERYEPRDIFVDREGAWHVHGVAMDPERALKGVDVAFNAMHGEYGEDGQLQRALDKLGVPYTGSDAFASALSFNKHHTKEAMQKLGLKVPYSTVIDFEPAQDGEIEALAQRLFRSFPQPSVVKPVWGSSGAGVRVAQSYHGLEHALRDVAKYSTKIMVEEYIPGREASVGVIDNYRGEELYALVPTQSVFSHDEKGRLAELARAAHRGLGLSHYSDSDFIVSKRGIYYLESNALPKLHGESKLAGALSYVGASLTHFIDHVIELAHGRRKTI